MNHMSQDEMREVEIRNQTARHAAAIRSNAAAGHQQTLDALDEDLCFLISQPGVMTQIIRASQAVGALSAGQLVTALVGRCIEARAECEAIKEVDRMQGDDGRVDRAEADRELAY